MVKRMLCLCVAGSKYLKYRNCWAVRPLRVAWNFLFHVFLARSNVMQRRMLQAAQGALRQRPPAWRIPVCRPPACLLSCRCRLVFWHVVRTHTKRPVLHTQTQASRPFAVLTHMAGAPLRPLPSLRLVRMDIHGRADARADAKHARCSASDVFTPAQHVRR